MSSVSGPSGQQPVNYYSTPSNQKKVEEQDKVAQGEQQAQGVSPDPEDSEMTIQIEKDLEEEGLGREIDKLLGKSSFVQVSNQVAVNMEGEPEIDANVRLANAIFDSIKECQKATLVKGGRLEIINKLMTAQTEKMKAIPTITGEDKEKWGSLMGSILDGVRMGRDVWQDALKEEKADYDGLIRSMEDWKDKLHYSQQILSSISQGMSYGR